MPDDIIGLSSFQGTIMHSSGYCSPEQVRNKRVIIAGASMNAVKTAADMATTAKHVKYVCSLESNRKTTLNQRTIRSSS